MISILSKIFIKDRDNMESPSVRRAYGMLCGALGIGLNLGLSLGKFIAGALSGSISVIADAFNNLLDAASSIITLVGFRMAGQKPDSDHPFGHGRIEYISGFLVAILTLLTMVELAKSSLEKILNPQELSFSPLVISLLAVSILIKCYMCLYNRKLGMRLDSPSMRAAAVDSMSDALATTVVLLSALISHFAQLSVDGWCGLVVCLFIGYAGYGAAKDAVSPLLGQAPDRDFVRRVNEIVLSCPEILGIHDLIVHNYGPGSVLISLHAEVSADGELLALHELIDGIEHRLRDELQCNAVIHLDPVRVGDRETERLLLLTKQCLVEIDAALTVHDFRITACPDRSKLFFDVAAPYDLPLSDEKLTEEIKRRIKEKNPDLLTVIEIDRREG